MANPLSRRPEKNSMASVTVHLRPVGKRVHARLSVREGAPVWRLTHKFASAESPIAMPTKPAKERVKEAESALEESQKLAVAMTQENARLRMELITMKRTIQEQKSDLERAQIREDELVQSAVTDTGTIEQLHSERDMLRTQCADLRTQLDQKIKYCSSELDAFQSKLSCSEDLIASLNAENAQLLAATDDHIRERDAALSQLQEMCNQANEEVLNATGTMQAPDVPLSCSVTTGDAASEARDELHRLADKVEHMHSQLSSSQEAFQRAMLTMVANISLQTESQRGGRGDDQSPLQHATSQEASPRPQTQSSSVHTQTREVHVVNHSAFELMREVVDIATDLATACHSQNERMETLIFRV